MMKFWGAIAGDFYGSVLEHKEIKGFNLPLDNAGNHFTDETVLTLATARVMKTGSGFAQVYSEAINTHADMGFSPSTRAWAEAHPESRAQGVSEGNGAASRVSPIAYFSSSVEGVLSQAGFSAVETHNSDEGVRGAQAVALAVYLATQNYSPESIIEKISKTFFYDLSFDIDELHKEYAFSSLAEYSVPQALYAALTSSSFEDALRRVMYIGGDTDTMMSIAGAIAEALYGSVPDALLSPVKAALETKHPDLYLQAVELSAYFPNNINNPF